MKKKINEVKDFILEYKKQCIIVGILFVSLLVTIGVTNAIKTTVYNTQMEAYNAWISLKDERTAYQAQVEGMQNFVDPNANHANEQIVYVGTQIDQGKFTTDQTLFWNFIKDAFNYNSTQEYMNFRERYRQQLGDCLFTTNFLDPVAQDPTTGAWADGGARTCVAQASNFVLIPIRINKAEDGSVVSYDYLAYITFSSSYSTAQYGSNKVIFTFTIDMNDTLTNFECYPVHANR